MTDDEELIERTERNRRPTHPGEILEKEFLEPADISQTELARHVGCDVKTVNRLVNEHTGVTPEMALKLAAALNTTPELWMNLQRSVDLWEARRAETRTPEPMFDPSEYSTEVAPR